MNDPSLKNASYRSLTDQQLSKIDELCDRFDRELLNGGAPRMEALLAEVPEGSRDGLLAELLAMELEHRTQQGYQPQPDDYFPRFPQQVSIVESVFVRVAKTQLPRNPKDCRTSPPSLPTFD